MSTRLVSQSTLESHRLGRLLRPVTHIQSAIDALNTPGATMTVALPTAPRVGNLVVVVVNSATYKSGDPSGFTLRKTIASQQGVYVYTRVTQSGDTGSVTYDPNGDYETVMSVHEFAATYSAVESVQTENTASQTSRSYPSITAGGRAYLLVAATGVTAGAPCSSFSHSGALPLTADAGSSLSQAAFLVDAMGGDTSWSAGSAFNTYGIAVKLDTIV